MISIEESFALYSLRGNKILELCLNEVLNELSANDLNFANFEKL